MPIEGAIHLYDLIVLLLFCLTPPFAPPPLPNPPLYTISLSPPSIQLASTSLSILLPHPLQTFLPYNFSHITFDYIDFKLHLYFSDPTIASLRYLSPTLKVSLQNENPRLIISFSLVSVTSVLLFICLFHYFFVVVILDPI